MSLSHPPAVQTTRHTQLPGRIDAQHVEQCPVPVQLQHAVDSFAAAVLRDGQWPVQLGLAVAAAVGLWHGKTHFLWFWCRQSDTTWRVQWKPIESQ